MNKTDKILKDFGIIEVIEKESIPPNSNPYHYDLYNMGTDLGNNITAMFGNHRKERMRYLILINNNTGKRIRFVFSDND